MISTFLPKRLDVGGFADWTRRMGPTDYLEVPYTVGVCPLPLIERLLLKLF